MHREVNMKENIIILVDEMKEVSSYVVCHESRGIHKILTSGRFSTSEELRKIQAQYENASVQIDCAFMGSEIQRAAEHYKWKLLKFKNGDFQFIEAMIQLARHHGY